jgi:hypothetical protein
MPTEPHEVTGRRRPRRHGNGGRWEPYALLGAIAGIVYLLALVWLRWRS